MHFNTIKIPIREGLDDYLHLLYDDDFFFVGIFYRCLQICLQLATFFHALHI